MKRFLLLALLFPLLAFGQRQVTVTLTPKIAGVSIDSLVLVSGNDTVKAHDDIIAVSQFADANIEGSRVICTDSLGRLVWGATVESLVDSVTIILSDTARGTDSLSTLHFEYYTSVAYTSGDALGWQFKLEFPAGTRTSKEFILKQVYVTDTTDQGGNFDISIWNGPIAQVANNAAIALLEADWAKLLGYVLVDTWTDLGDFDVGYETPNIAIAQSPGPYYIQLISRGTPTYTGPYPLKLKLIFSTSD